MCSKAATEIEVKFPYENVGLVLVEASKLSLDDEFMQYEPQKKEEEKLKKVLEVLIPKGINDLWCMKHNPVLNSKRDGICYKSNGNLPLGKSFEWWDKAAKEFLPEIESDVATRTQLLSVYGVLLQKLVESGVDKAYAWHLASANNIELVRYLTSQEAKSNPNLDGIREINLFGTLVSKDVMVRYEKSDGYWKSENFYCDYVTEETLSNCNLENAYWISRAHEIDGQGISIADFAICSVTDRAVSNTIGFVVCNTV